MAGKTHFPRFGGNTWAQSFYTEPGSIYDPGFTTGNVWYVNSATGSDTAGYGYSADAPLKTIGYAVATAAVASNGDRVYVMPGHTETLTGAAGINMSTAGVTLIGLGTGRTRPVISYTTNAAASFDVNGANCSIENIVFKPIGVATVTAAVNVKAADCWIRKCEFEFADATNQAAISILTNASANRMKVEDCWFHGSNNGTSTAIKIVGGDASKIVNCDFSGAFTATGGIVITNTTDATNLIIDHCSFQNYTAMNTKSIVLTASTTGYIKDCVFQILSGTAPITGAAAAWCGRNYYAATIATGSTLV